MPAPLSALPRCTVRCLLQGGRKTTSKWTTRPREGREDLRAESSCDLITKTLFLVLTLIPQWAHYRVPSFLSQEPRNEGPVVEGSAVAALPDEVNGLIRLKASLNQRSGDDQPGAVHSRLATHQDAEAFVQPS